MILVDYRQGSQELVSPLAALGLPVDETTLDFGDVAFEGRGAAGAHVNVGIEFKKLGELIGSLRSERLQGHQLPGMCAMYDYRYLLVEGELHYNRQGTLVQTSKFRRGEPAPMPGNMTIGELVKRLHVLQMCAGMTTIWSRSRKETLLQIQLLYRVWTDTALDEHKSHLGDYTPPSTVPLSPFRSVIQKFPNVGRAVSAAAQSEFRSIYRAVNATTEEWAELQLADKHGKLKRFGTKNAESVMEVIHREHE